MFRAAAPGQLRRAVSPGRKGRAGDLRAAAYWPCQAEVTGSHQSCRQAVRCLTPRSKLCSRRTWPLRVALPQPEFPRPWLLRGPLGLLAPPGPRVSDAAAVPLGGRVWNPGSRRLPRTPTAKGTGRRGRPLLLGCSAGGPSLGVSLENLQTDGSVAREPWVVGSTQCFFPRGDKVYLFSEGLPRKTIFWLSAVREQPVEADQFQVNNLGSL